MKCEVRVGGKTCVVELTRNSETWRISLEGNPLDVDVVEVAANTFSVLINGESYEVRITPKPDGTLVVNTNSEEHVCEVVDPRAWRGRRHGAMEVEGRQQISAPMPGKVVRVLVEEGNAVEAGQGIMVVEAMKMQNEIRSPKSGRVEKILVKEGQAVSSGDILAWVE